MKNIIIFLINWLSRYLKHDLFKSEEKMNNVKIIIVYKIFEPINQDFPILNYDEYSSSEIKKNYLLELEDHTTIDFSLSYFSNKLELVLKNSNSHNLELTGRIITLLHQKIMYDFKDEIESGFKTELLYSTMFNSKDDKKS